jgi:hypothetical protein
VDDDLVTVASRPDGTQFAIFIAPPGSTLDDDGLLGGGVVGLLIGVVKAGRRAGSSKWRVVVQQRSAVGRLGPVLNRTVLDSEDQAHARMSELVQRIEAGESLG